MRKTIIYIILLMVFLTLLLSGCIQIDIDTGIDMDFTSYLSYRIELSVSELDLQYQDALKNSLNRIGWHYQENLGFIVELHTETEPCLLIMTKRIENDSFEQAFESLEDMLTNEDITPFMQVDMAFQSLERQKRYSISAETDIPQIMRLSNAEDLTPALQLQLEDAMETGEGEITLRLPASELVSITHQANVQNNQAVMVVPLSFTDQTGFRMAGMLNLQRDGMIGGSLEEIVQEQTRLRNISILVCGAALIILLITLLVNKLTKMR